jgi:hypothetical protein
LPDCEKCPAGKHSDEISLPNIDSNVCQQCDPGKYASMAGATGCVECPAGKYAMSTGSSICTDCVACPVYEMRVGCTTTSSGYCAPRNPCVAGQNKSTLINAIQTFDVCAPVLNGLWLLDPYLSQMWYLSDFVLQSYAFRDLYVWGFRNPHRGQDMGYIPGDEKSDDSISKLKILSYITYEGSFLNPWQVTGSWNCYNPTSNQWYINSLTNVSNVMCTNCSVGKFSAIVNAQNCELYATGKYMDTSGASTCKQCPENSDSVAGSDKITDCKCPAGNYLDTSGTSTCKQCPENSDSVAGSDNITDCKCMTGFFGENGGYCNRGAWACPNDYWAPEQSFLCDDQSCKASASSTYEGLAANVIDGNYQSKWEGSLYITGTTITIDFQRTVYVKKIIDIATSWEYQTVTLFEYHVSDTTMISTDSRCFSKTHNDLLGTKERLLRCRGY